MSRMKHDAVSYTVQKPLPEAILTYGEQLT